MSRQGRWHGGCCTWVELGNSFWFATSPHGEVEQRQLTADGTGGTFAIKLGQPPFSLQQSEKRTGHQWISPFISASSLINQTPSCSRAGQQV